MIIDLKTINHIPSHYNLNIQPDWWLKNDENDQILGLDGPLVVNLKIAKLGSKFIINGQLSGRVKLLCDRCLEPFLRDLQSEFEISLFPNAKNHNQSEIELIRNDLDCHILLGDEVELFDIIRDQIYLTMPIKSLCSEGCRGLCTVCGENLDFGLCDCKTETWQHSFSKLKTLLS